METYSTETEYEPRARSDTIPFLETDLSETEYNPYARSDTIPFLETALSPTERKPSSELSGPGPQNQEVDYVVSATGDVDYRVSSVKSHTGRPIPVTYIYGEHKRSNRQQQEV